MAGREPINMAASGPRAERARGVKQAVVQEAATLFAEHGYDGVSLDEVAARAGVKRTLILYHFSNKTALWMQAVKFIADMFDARMAERLATIEPSNDADRLRGMIRASFETLAEVPQYGRVLVREGCVAGPRVDWLARCFSPPALRFDDPSFARRLNHTLLRDVMIGAILTATTLGPLLEASLSVTAGKRREGILPLSIHSREELVELLMTMVASHGDGR